MHPHGPIQGPYVAVVPSESMGVVVLTNENYPGEVRVKAAMELIEALAADGRRGLEAGSLGSRPPPEFG